MEAYANSNLCIHQPVKHEVLVDNRRILKPNQANSMPHAEHNLYYNNSFNKSGNMVEVTYSQPNQDNRRNVNIVEKSYLANSPLYESCDSADGNLGFQTHPNKITYLEPNHFPHSNSIYGEKKDLASNMKQQCKYKERPNTVYRRKSRSIPRFSPLQREKLEEEFEKSSYIGREESNDLACLLKLTEKQVETWFRNRRTKQKKESERISFNESSLRQSRETPDNKRQGNCTHHIVSNEELTTNNQIMLMHNYYQYPSPALPPFESQAFPAPRMDYFGNQWIFGDYGYAYNPYYYDMNYYYNNQNFYHVA